MASFAAKSRLKWLIPLTCFIGLGILTVAILLGIGVIPTSVPKSKRTPSPAKTSKTTTHLPLTRDVLSGEPGDVITRFANDGTGWEPHIKAMIHKIVSAGSTCVDVGANLGIHTLAMSAATGPGGHVFAIEPQAVALKHLTLNTAGCTNVSIVPAAAGKTCAPKSVRMCPPVHGNMGATSIDFKGAHGFGELLDVVTVDSLAQTKPVSFIKIDVEGYEMQVLQGATTTIRNARPLMLVEIQERCLVQAGTSTAAVMRWLMGQGYVLYRIQCTEPRNTFWADHLCVPKEKDGERNWAATTGFPCERFDGHGLLKCVFTPAVEHAYTTAEVLQDTTLSIHAMCFNEEDMLPLFVTYYQSLFGDKVHIHIHDNESTDGSRAVALALGCAVHTFTTGGKFNELTLTERRSSCWWPDEESSTWVLVCDVDEFLTITPELLASCAAVPCVKANGIQMVGTDSEHAWPTTITCGYPDNAYSKCVLFQRAAFQQVRFANGSHNAQFVPYGAASFSSDLIAPRAEMVLYHFKYLSAQFAYDKLHPRFCRRDSAMSASIDLQGQQATSLLAMENVMHAERGKCTYLLAASTVFASLPPPVFTQDWVYHHVREVLQQVRTGELSVPSCDALVVEIGAFEGRTTLDLASTFPNHTIVSVGPWGAEITEQFGRFLRNTCRVRNQVRVRRGKSADILASWDPPQVVKFACIDGDHSAEGVYTDARFIWPHVVPEGLVLFQDYKWASPELDGLQCPKLGIRQWLSEHTHDAQVLFVSEQVLFVRKLA
jgi:FkbM family methyltransferase